MLIRKYRTGDIHDIVRLFHETVHAVNAKDYTREQLAAWSDGKADTASWDKSLKGHFAVVATEGNTVTGFGDIDCNGYLDRLYVHKDWQGRGIATAICDMLERQVQGPITVHSSITAKTFFEKRGYKVIRRQTVERDGIKLTNFIMEK